MNAIVRRLRGAAPRVIALLAAVVLAGSMAAATPAPTDSLTYRSASSLTRATKVDRILLLRVHIDLPVRSSVIGGTIKERVAYHYPGTSWPGGHSNTYLFGHARAGTFLNLWKVRVGDIVRLHLVNGSWVRYRVTMAKRVAWNDGRWTLLTSSERITLQTCTSWYRTAPKFVVVAVPYH